MIQAKVKQDYRFGKSLQAFSRLEFVKDEWRDVPTHLEEEARAHEWLEVRERPVVEPGAIETLAPAAQIEEPENGLTESEKVLEQMLEESGEPTSEQLLDKMLEEAEESEGGEPTAENKEPTAMKPKSPRRTGRAGKRG